MNARLSTILADVRRRFQRIYGGRLVRLVLFGSQARDDAEPGSDIDLLVVLSGEVSPCEEIARSEHDVAEASLEHDVVVCCVFVSEEQYEHERSPLLLNARREGVAL